MEESERATTTERACPIVEMTADEADLIARIQGNSDLNIEVLAARLLPQFEGILDELKAQDVVISVSDSIGLLTAWLGEDLAKRVLAELITYSREGS